MAARVAVLIPLLATVLAGCTEPVRQADIPEELPAPSRRYDLNTVTFEQLRGIESHGRSLLPRDAARNIVEFRRQFRYRRVEDLLAVRGIGEVTFLKIRRFFYVLPPGSE